MGKWRRVLWAGLIVVALGLVAWMALRPVEPPEPVYGGKPLSYWLGQYVISLGSTNYDGGAAIKAVKQIGTNGIPYYLKMLRAQDSGIEERLAGLLAKQSVVKIQLRPPELQNMEGADGFEVLGAEGSGAVLNLIQIYQARYSSFSQAETAKALGSIGPPAKAAVLVLLSNLLGRSDQVDAFTIAALERIHADPELVVPAYVKCAENPDQLVRTYAVVSLRRLGSNVLAQLSTNSDAAIRSAATNALKQIEPEAVAKVLAK